MRWALFLLLPLLVSGSCGCGEVENELEWERKVDAKYHACRNCKAIDPTEEACPAIGYECNVEWPLTTNVLSPTDSCRCVEARCAGAAKLASNKAIVNKIRCNNSEWIVGDVKTTSVVCAKSCNTGTCKPSNSKASFDLKPLLVKPADVNNRCATGSCDSGYDLVAIDDAGSVLQKLADVSTVICSGEGNWLNEGAHYKYVMCKESTCEYKCDAVPFSTDAWGGDPALLTAPNRKDCSFTCPANTGLFRLGPVPPRPISIMEATCESSGKYRVNAALSVDKIGCYKCDLDDGVLSTENAGDGKAKVQNCMLYCDEGFILTYFDPSSPKDYFTVDRLYRLILYVQVVHWYNAETGLAVENWFRFECRPKQS